MVMRALAIIYAAAERTSGARLPLVSVQERYKHYMDYDQDSGLDTIEIFACRNLWFLMIYIFKDVHAKV